MSTHTKINSISSANTTCCPEYEGVFVIVEQRFSNVLNVSKELIGEGKRLAQNLNSKITAILLGNKMDNWVSELLRYGADEVIYAVHPLLEHYTPDAYSQVISELILEHKPEIVMFGATAIGRELAPTLSAKLHTGLTADCTHLEIDAATRNLLQTRPAFGGNIMATIQCSDHRPQMCTVRPGVMQAAIYNTECVVSGKIIKFVPVINEADIRTKILTIHQETKNSVAIEDSPIIISGGRGLGDAKGFNLLNKLANKLNGCVASSRACVDNGWIEKSYQVGQTGKTVRPKLYIACGISGAIQHIAGMEESECIVAINTDPNAPIFSIADYGIVGDVYDVIPRLLQTLDTTENAADALSMCVDFNPLKNPTSI